MQVPEPVQQQRVRPARQRREIELREHADETWMPYLDWRSSQVKSSQVKSNQVKSSQVKSSQDKPSQVKSSQVKSSQVKSSQVRSGQVTFHI
jgi:hypothetical protein